MGLNSNNNNNNNNTNYSHIMILFLLSSVITPNSLNSNAIFVWGFFLSRHPESVLPKSQRLKDFINLSLGQKITYTTTCFTR